MKPHNVNAKWAKTQTFKNFCKEPQINKLSKEEQKSLYEAVTGKRVRVNSSVDKEDGGE